MFENFKKISIQGGYFEDPVTLEVFKGAAPLSIVYGRKESGGQELLYTLSTQYIPSKIVTYV